ncbi:MAG: hypothetical protein LBM75_07175 [Myxococcales bacterium]|jgi:hypothetical protein|nr:hypothetical protein [Myxococcales bacterium]
MKNKSIIPGWKRKPFYGCTYKLTMERIGAGKKTMMLYAILSKDSRFQKSASAKPLLVTVGQCDEWVREQVKRFGVPGGYRGKV